jgi:F-type H+-transporting ATPase subunit b
MRRALVPLLFLSLLAFVAAPAGLAAEEGHAKEATNPVMPDLVVAIATIVVFALLLIVLTKTAWKPILSGLKAREEGIRGQIEGAEKANAEARALLEDHRKKVAAATEEARAIVEEGRKDAEALRAKVESEAVAEAARERERAVRDIQLAKDAALKDIYSRVADLATDVAGKILQQRLDAGQHRKLVDEAVTSFEASRKKPGGRA